MKYNCAAHACVARNDYAVALLRAGKVDRAIAEFLVGLENDPESPFLHKNLAAAYARKGQYKQALVHARESARKDPSVR
jgi:predicted Zn-dependent protease